VPIVEGAKRDTLTRFALSDNGNGERLVKRHGDDLRFCHELGWMCWDGQRWQQDISGEVRRRAVNTIRNISQDFDGDVEEIAEAMKWAGRCLSDSKIKAMLSCAEYQLPMPTVIGEFDTDPWWRDGRVHREYVGTGAIAELAALGDSVAREKRALERQQKRGAQAQVKTDLQVIETPLDTIDLVCKMVMNAAFKQAGYHRPKRWKWRKRRA